MKIDKDKICMCDCHIKGSRMRHIRACCFLCGKHYLNEDKTLDMEAYRLSCSEKEQNRKQAQEEALSRR